MRAVQALAAYAERDTNRALYDMSITFESTATTGWKKTVHLKKGNFGVLTTLKVSRCEKQVSIRCMCASEF